MLFDCSVLYDWILLLSFVAITSVLLVSVKVINLSVVISSVTSDACIAPKLAKSNTIIDTNIIFLLINFITYLIYIRINTILKKLLYIFFHVNKIIWIIRFYLEEYYSIIWKRIWLGYRIYYDNLKIVKLHLYWL